MGQQIIGLPVGKVVTAGNYRPVTDQDPELLNYFVGETRRRLGGILGEQLVIYFTFDDGFVYSSYEMAEKQLEKVRIRHPNASIFSFDLNTLSRNLRTSVRG